MSETTTTATTTITDLEIQVGGNVRETSTPLGRVFVQPYFLMAIAYPVGFQEKIKQNEPASERRKQAGKRRKHRKGKRQEGDKSKAGDKRYY